MIITFLTDVLTYDFKVEEDQKISDVLHVINENTEYTIDVENIKYITSSRLQEKINVFQTFKHAQIHNGDILEIGEIV